MTIQDLQKWVQKDWEINSKHTPTVEFQLLYIIEEFGEVAEVLRKIKGAKDRKNITIDLGSEFADLLIAIVTLANCFEIDLNSEIELFQCRITERHKQGY
ncbi:MAG: MazG-like family protein [Patescibacteria group bacterium]